MSTLLEDRVLRNGIAIDSLSNGVGVEMVEALDRARTSLLSLLAGDSDSEFSQFQRQQILASIDGTLVNVNGAYRRIITDARREVLEKEFESTTRALFKEAKAVAPVEFGLPIGRLETLLAKPLGGKTLETWVNSSMNGLTQGIKQELTQGLILGETAGQVRRRITEQFGIGRNAADVLTRTALLQSSKDSLDEVYRNNEDIIIGYEYMATLDSRTCLQCAPNDGLIEENRNDLPQPLIHPRCRCRIVPRTRFSQQGTRPSVETYQVNEDAASDRTKGDKYKGRVVHHREGTKEKPVTSRVFRPDRVKQVRGSTTFEQFFRRQPPAFQRSYLGPGKFDLWKEAGRPQLKELTAFNKGQRRILRLGELGKEMSN